eukprot:TRINITY_DN1956_c1_g2_i2.p1 TRINITY_DN1956_c1_g2~~TRINITY_DN1956_c1_g2_i2.p1  ORF type:complete len:267 (+),score=26.34 TRINITY_DN1956_c1_g2_i2:73-801(+)
MSGGVGPTCKDIHLQEEEDEQQERDQNQNNLGSSISKTPQRRRFLSFNQLNSLAVIIILSASGMVSIEDLFFILFSFFYIYFLSKFAFPSSNQSPEPPIFGRNNKLLAAYVSVGALIGLFCPIAYILHGIFEGDKEGIKAAAPHLFLLSSQIFMEGVTFSGGFSVPIRAFVPVFYNGKRVFTIFEWLRREMGKREEKDYRLIVGRGLAMANLAFWCFNLFGFLVPVYLPRVFKKYYGYKEKA